MDRPQEAYDGEEAVERARAGDSEAMAQVIEANRPLLHALAGRLCAPGPLLDELMQAGSIGLMQAVRRFDPGRGVQLTTYAVPWVLGEMKRALRCALDGTGAQAKRAQLLRCEEAFVRHQARAPRTEEVAACAMNSIMQAAKAMERPLSVEAFEEEGHALTGEDDINFDRLALRMALPSLAPQERGVLLLRYYRDLTQQETARLLGKSQAQISRLERRALDALRMLLA